MDLNLVSAFVEVAQAQSVTRAAENLGLPKSSVSRRVSELEKELGVRLLQRTTRKVTLTEAGREYYEQVERALASLQRAAESASGTSELASGIVRLTAPVDLGALALPELIAKFNARYPEIHIELSLTSRIVNLQEEGFDLALRAQKRVDPALVSREIGTSDLGLFASPAYLQRHGRPEQLADLARHACVLFRGQHGKALWVFEGPNGEGSVEVRGPVDVDELLFVRQAIAVGLGIGLLPVVSFLDCSRGDPSQLLERILPEYSRRGGALHILTPSGQRPKRVTLLRDFLLEELGKRIAHARA